MSKYVFFLDTVNPAVGKQLIFIDLAAYLADTTDNEIYYVNRVHEKDYDRHHESKLNYCDIDNIDFSSFEGATFFTPVNYLLHLLARIKSLASAKICLYVYDPKATSWLFSHIDCPAKNDKIIKLFKGTKACAFVDKNCVRQFADLDKIVYMPIALNDSITNDYKELPIVDKGAINIGYLGAISMNITNTIKNIITNMIAAEIEKSINFHIIGPIGPLFKVNLISPPNVICRYICTGKITDEQSAEYIKKNVDLLIATEANAVKAASYGVPVVIPVTDDKPFKGNNYVYFYDTNGYVFKWNNDLLMTLNNDVHTLKKALQHIYDNDLKVTIGKACYDFCIANCSLEKVAQQFFSLVENCSLSIELCMKEDAILERINRYERYLAKTGGTMEDYITYEKALKSNGVLAKNSISEWDIADFDSEVGSSIDEYYRQNSMSNKKRNRSALARFFIMIANLFRSPQNRLK